MNRWFASKPVRVVGALIVVLALFLAWWMVLRGAEPRVRPTDASWDTVAACLEPPRWQEVEVEAEVQHTVQDESHRFIERVHVRWVPFHYEWEQTYQNERRRTGQAYTQDGHVVLILYPREGEPQTRRLALPPGTPQTQPQAWLTWWRRLPGFAKDLLLPATLLTDARYPRVEGESIFLHRPVWVVVQAQPEHNAYREAWVDQATCLVLRWRRQDANRQLEIAFTRLRLSP